MGERGKLKLDKLAPTPAWCKLKLLFVPLLPLLLVLLTELRLMATPVLLALPLPLPPLLVSLEGVFRAEIEVGGTLLT